MRVTIDLSGLKRVKWHEYAIRFLFGGLSTVLAGFIAQRFGPALGGLFLAFPAILPASVTLIEKQERAKKKRAGISGTRRGRQAAAVDAYGAALGAIGLLCFAVVASRLLPEHNAAFALCAALAAWGSTSFLLWRIRKSDLWR